jgi:hypothetical protein
MLIEFQLNSTGFLTAFRNQLKLIPACLPQPLDLNFGDCNGWSLLDHVHFSDGTTLVKTANGDLEIHQPVELFFVSVDGLEAHGVNPTPPCFNPTLTLIFDLTLALFNNIPSICLNYDEVTAPGLTDEDEQLINDILSGLVAQECNAIDLGPLSDLLGGPVTLLGAGLSASDSLDRLAIRLEVVSSGSSQEWSDFFAGKLLPNPLSKDWSLFLDKRLVEDGIQQRFLAALEASDKFSLDSGPDCHYNPVAAVPMFSVSFSGEAIDACVCLWGQIDLNVDMFPLIVLSVPEENAIQLDLELLWGLNDAEVVCCAFTAGMFWFFIGTQLLQEEKINWGEFLGGLGMPVSFTATLLGAHDLVGEQAELPPEWQPIGSSGTKYRLRQELNFGNVLGDITLDSVHGLTAGPVLGGSIGAVADLQDPKLLLFTQFAEFTWEIVDPCADVLVLATRASVTLSNVNPSPGTPQVPIFVCDVQVIEGSDPANQFAPHLQWSNSGISISLTTDQLTLSYKVAPYACRLRIVTNGGVRIISIPPIPILTDAEIQEHLDEATAKQVIDCKDDLAFGHDFWKGSKYNPKWGPYPPDAEAFLQLWDVVLTGLVPSETVSLELLQGDLVATGRASGRGTVQMSALVRAGGEEGDGGIALLRAVGDPGSRSPEQTITLKQVALSERGLLTAAAPVVALRGGRFKRAPTIAFITTHGFYVYDLLIPGFSRLVHHEAEAGLRGILGWHGGFLVWGERGLRLAGGNSVTPVVPGPILDVVIGGARIYVLTPERLALYDRSFREIGSLSVRGGTHLAFSHTTLVVTEGNLIQFYEASSSAQLERKASHEITDLVAIESAPLAASHDAFFARKTSGGLVLALSGPNEVVEAVRFDQLPWFSEYRRTDDILARIGQDSRQIELHSMVKTETRLR